MADEASPPSDMSVYDVIGGETVVRNCMTDLVGRLRSDGEFADVFATHGVDFDGLTARLTTFLVAFLIEGPPTDPAALAAVHGSRFALTPGLWERWFAHLRTVLHLRIVDDAGLKQLTVLLRTLEHAVTDSRSTGPAVGQTPSGGLRAIDAPTAVDSTHRAGRED